MRAHRGPLSMTSYTNTSILGVLLIVTYDYKLLELSHTSGNYLFLLSNLLQFVPHVEQMSSALLPHWYMSR